MRIVVLTCCICIQIIGNAVVYGQSQTQVCPDSAISTCIRNVTVSGIGRDFFEYLIYVYPSCSNHISGPEYRSRLSNLTLCLEQNGCSAESTGKVKNAIQSGVERLCAIKKDRLLAAVECWNKNVTKVLINTCNDTFVASLGGGNPYCPAADAYLNCTQNSVLSKCGDESAIYHVTYTYATLAGFAAAKDCKIWDNRCLPWNITSCLTNMNTIMSWTGQGKSQLSNNLDTLCRREDPVSKCIKSQNCTTDKAYYLVVAGLLDTAFSTICTQRNKISSYEAYADCWTKDSIKNGLASCNTTFQSDLLKVNRDFSYCSAVNILLKCTLDLVTAECGADSGKSMTAYFHTLLTPDAIINKCGLDSKYINSTAWPTATFTFSTSVFNMSSTVNSTSTAASTSWSTSLILLVFVICMLRLHYIDAHVTV